MRNVRRYDPEGAPVFVTVVCRDHAPLLSSLIDKEKAVGCLRQFRRFGDVAVYAWVLLDDHMHMLVGHCQPDLSTVVGRFKQAVVIALRRPSIWQARFYDHIIRGPRDLQAHLDYIHYNPRKHGYVDRPCDYRWSSIHTFVARGIYSPDWGSIEPPDTFGEDIGSE